jgi:predicted phosphodiesterase
MYCKHWPTEHYRGRPGVRDRRRHDRDPRCSLAGKLIYVLHDLKTLQADPGDGIDVIVSGTCVPKIYTVAGVLNLNPGSAGRRRFKLPITLATLEVTREGMRSEIHDLGGD